MENQEYVIKGTIDGMIKILTNDFGMPEDEAKYFIYIKINQHNKDAENTISKDELDLWYLSDNDKYEGEIFKTHLSINFTSLEKKLLRAAYKFMAQYIFSRNIDLVLLGIDLVYIILNSIERIEDTDYCVFSRIVELCVGNKEKLFSVNDIQTSNSDGKCDYQEGDWKCTYFGQHEACTCNTEKVKLSFENLAQKGILKRVGDRWMLVK